MSAIFNSFPDKDKIWCLIHPKITGWKAIVSILIGCFHEDFLDATPFEFSWLKTFKRRYLHQMGNLKKRFLEVAFAISLYTLKYPSIRVHKSRVYETKQIYKKHYSWPAWFFIKSLEGLLIRSFLLFKVNKIDYHHNEQRPRPLVLAVS